MVDSRGLSRDRKSGFSYVPESRFSRLACLTFQGRPQTTGVLEKYCHWPILAVQFERPIIIGHWSVPVDS